MKVLPNRCFAHVCWEIDPEDMRVCMRDLKCFSEDLLGASGPIQYQKSTLPLLFEELFGSIYRPFEM